MLSTNTSFYRAITALVVVTICWTPTWLMIGNTEALAQVLSYTVSTAYAEDQILTAAQAGQSFGRDQVNQFSSPTLDNGQMNFPDAGESLNLDELYPDSNVSTPGDTDDLRSLYGSEQDFESAGQDASARLTNENSTTGAAYRVLVKQTQLEKPDLSNDPIFTQTDEVNENIDLIGAGFADCNTETTYQNDSISAHVPDLRHCTRNTLPIDNACEAHQIVNVQETGARVLIGAYVPSTATFRVDLKNGTWVNTDGDGGKNYAAQIPTLDYDLVCSGDGPRELEVAQRYDWPEAPVQGDFDSSSDYNVLQKPTCENDLVGIFQLRDNKGEYRYKYGADFRLVYRAVKDAYWDDEQCTHAIQTAKDFCGSDVEISVQGGLNPSGCATFNGATICDDSPLAAALTPPADGYSKWQNQVNISGMTPDSCPYWRGAMSCWTDAQGDEHCPQVDTFNNNQCAKYEDDPDCGYISTECADGGESASGQCVVQTETWDCGYDADVPTLTSNTEYSCEGEIRCMGSECADPNGQTSNDFARATAALQAAEAIRQDGSCTEAQDAGDDVVENCKIFKGEAYECKKAVGGYVDCCETPDSVSMGDYLTLMFNTHEAMTTSLASTSLGGTAVSGAWETLRQPYQTGWDGVTSAWSSIKGGFSNAFDSLTGSSTAAASEGAKTGVIAGAKQALMKKTAQWAADAFGPQAANALFVTTTEAGVTTGAVDATTGQLTDQAASEGGVQLGGAVGTALSGVMLAYTIYSVTKLLIEIIYACEEEEFVLGAKRKLKSCHYVGSYCASKVLGVCIEKRQSYCCFNSPLSRIIQEQARPQLGIGWGDKKEPDCRPLTTSQITEIDWDKINLDEWLGILQSNGHWPDSSTLNAEALTGLGSPLSTGDRENVIERSQNRIDGIDIQNRRHEAAGDILDDIGPQPLPDLPFESE